MSQHDYVIADQNGLSFLADLNAALAANVGLNSGATEPATPYAYMLWADTTSGLLKQRNAANNAWISLALMSNFALPSVQTQLATRFTAGGTSDAITGTLAPAIAAYSTGLRVTTTVGANTVTAPTINLNSLGAKTIKKRHASGSKVALALGDYNASGPFDLEYDGTDFVLLNPTFVIEPYIYVRDEVASGSASGTFTAGAWRTRTLNTEVVDTAGICSLASNELTLPAGTYRYRAAAPAHYVNQHKLRLYNVTDAAVIADSYGMSVFATNTGAAVETVATTVGRFTIAGAKAIRLEHRCDTTQATNGFGVACSFASTVEVYAQLELWKES